MSRGWRGGGGGRGEGQANVRGECPGGKCPGGNFRNTYNICVMGTMSTN